MTGAAPPAGPPPAIAGPPPPASGHFGGTWGTVLLPIRSDEAIDFPVLEDELDVLLKVGLAGIYTCGTAGEFHTLEEDEFDALSQLVAEMARRAGSAFQIGASHMSGQISLSRIRRASALAPSAIQVILPDWLPLSATEVERAMDRMLDELVSG